LSANQPIGTGDILSAATKGAGEVQQQQQQQQGGAPQEELDQETPRKAPIAWGNVASERGEGI